MHKPPEKTKKLKSQFPNILVPQGHDVLRTLRILFSTVKWRETTKQNIENDADAPAIDLGSISPGFLFQHCTKTKISIFSKKTISTLTTSWPVSGVPNEVVIEICTYLYMYTASELVHTLIHTYMGHSHTFRSHISGGTTRSGHRTVSFFAAHHNLRKTKIRYFDYLCVYI